MPTKKATSKKAAPKLDIPKVKLPTKPQTELLKQLVSSRVLCLHKTDKGVDTAVVETRLGNVVKGTSARRSVADSLITAGLVVPCPHAKPVAGHTHFMLSDTGREGLRAAIKAAVKAARAAKKAAQC